MKSRIKNVLIGLGIVALLVITSAITSYFKEWQIKKETTLRVESEMRFKQLQKEVAALSSEKDSISSIINQKQALIDYLENNPQVIIQNNDKSHLDIDRLNAYNSILRFTDNATKYENNRERYSLHRFSKQN